MKWILYFLFMTACGHAYASEFSQEEILGFRVLVEKKIDEAGKVLLRQRLDTLLREIQEKVPKIFFAMKPNLKIWVTDSQWEENATAYHFSRSWLVYQGLIPQMEKGIEIVNVKNFLAWSVPEDQPMMLLHEFVHAYHDQVLGPNNSKIHEAFQRIINSGKYKSAYANVNEDEYLAEISEAYFGKNDYFPFTRSELKAYDPKGFALVKALFE